MDHLWLSNLSAKGPSTRIIGLGFQSPKNRSEHGFGDLKPTIWVLGPSMKIISYPRIRKINLRPKTSGVCRKHPELQPLRAPESCFFLVLRLGWVGFSALGLKVSAFGGLWAQDWH